MRCMSTAKTGHETGQASQGGLFGVGDLAPGEAATRQGSSGGTPRVMSPQRHQVELRPVDLDALLASDHPARAVLAFVQVLELAPLYARIKSAGSRGGAPAIDPA